MSNLPTAQPTPAAPAAARRRMGALPLLCLLAACGGGGGGGEEPPPPPPPPPPPAPTFSAYTLERSASAIDATVSTEVARSASALIPTAGGTITATGADGSTYRLDIPADALDAPTLITLTPAAASGLPIGTGGATQAGVELTPHGLVFANPVRLTITPATAIAVERQIVVQWPSGGGGVGFAAPDPAQAGLQVLLQHFSGVGVLRAATSFDDDMRAVRTRIGGDSTLRLESAAAEVAMRDRARRHASVSDAEGPVVRSALTGTLLGQYQGAVLDVRTAAANAAGANCGTVNQAVETLTLYQRLRQGLEIAGAQTALASGATALMPALAEACQKAEFERCRDSAQVQRILPLRNALQRRATLLGAAASVVDGADRYVAGCLRFDLDVTSLAGGRVPEYEFGETVTAGNMRLQWNAADNRIVGGAALTSLVANYAVVPRVPGTSVENKVTAPGRLDITGLELRTDSAGNLTDIAVALRPEGSDSSFDAVNTNVVPNQRETVTGITWSTAWTTVLESFAEVSGGAFVLTGWQLGGAQFARRVIDQGLDVSGSTLGVNDQYVLRHVPGL